MESSKTPYQIKEFDNFHLSDIGLMVNYPEIFDDEKFLVERDGQEYELQDWYCKNPDCDCTDVRFSVFLNDKEVGEIWYNYKKGEIFEPSNFAYLIAKLKKMGAEYFNSFNELLSLRHEVVKNEFNLFKLKKERDGYKEEIKTLKNTQPKIGRNALCLCGSGKKYKKCCLKSVGK